MATQIQIRRDTTTNWNNASTTVLAQGEMGLELNNSTSKVQGIKIGDGSASWADLEYAFPLLNGVDNLNDDGDDVVTFTLKGIGSQTAKVLGIKHSDDSVKFSVDMSGNIITKGDITMDAAKKVLIGAAAGTTTGVQIKSETDYGQLMTRSSSSAGATDAVIHHYKNNVSTFRVDNDGDIDKCKNIDASGVITTTSNVSAVNVTGSGVLNMTGAAEHNLNGILDMRTHEIINLVDPSTNQGAATKASVEAAVEAAKGWRHIETITASGVNDVEFDGLTGDNYMAFRIYVVDAYRSVGTVITRFFINSTSNTSLLNLSTSGDKANGYIEVSCSTSTTVKVAEARGVASGRFLNDITSLVVGGNISSFKIDVSISETMTGTFVLYGLKLT